MTSPSPVSSSLDRRPSHLTILLATLLAAVVLLPHSRADAGGSFVDDDGSTHEADIEWIAGQGITTGCNPPTNDRFCPDDPVTRAQMATFLTRALDLKPSNKDVFADDNTSTHESNIQALAASSITTGCNPPTNDRFCPDDPVTRAQMATFLRRALAPGAVSPGDLDLPTANCVEVVGFSQTRQWFSAGDHIFEHLVVDGQWQALIQGGGAIDRWIDPGYEGWSNPLASSCNTASNQPDVVLFTVTGGNRSVAAWVGAIEAVLETIYVKVPSAEHVILQPVVGGPNEQLCPAGGGETVRASENHPSVDSAIAQVAASRSDVSKGASPVVGTCAHYVDEVGHLSTEGADFVAGMLGEFYGDILG